MTKKDKYIYHWGNNPKRKEFKGRMCKILASGRMNTVLIEFENGEQATTSRRALRKARPKGSR